MTVSEAVNRLLPCWTGQSKQTAIFSLAMPLLRILRSTEHFKKLPGSEKDYIYTIRTDSDIKDL